MDNSLSLFLPLTLILDGLHYCNYLHDLARDFQFLILLLCLNCFLQLHVNYVAHCLHLQII
jgi:hypothetical protein